MASGGRSTSPSPFGSTKSTSATWPPAPGVASFPARALTASRRCLLDGAEGGKLVKLTKHAPDSDVWEGDEWAETLEQMLEEGMLPKGMPQEGF